VRRRALQLLPAILLLFLPPAPGAGGPWLFRVASSWASPLRAAAAHDPPKAKERTPTEKEIIAAIARREYEKALELIDRALDDSPDDPLLHYNAACALCLWGRLDDAALRLRVAVDKGFRDFIHMERDPDLEALRSHPTYQAILEGRDAAGRSAAQREVSRWRERFGAERYRYESDEALNLHFATALDERLHRRMVKMLQTQAEEQIRSLFAGAPREAVFIAIPTRQDAREFFAELARRDKAFDQPGVAGVYEHRPRRLVSADTGASLRHEFTHAMHYGDMERLGQSHPLWIQEGLATLYEDYDFTAEDRLVFLPNERDSTIQELLRTGEALPWRALMALEPREFMRRPQELYPQVRSIFRYVAARRKLTDWYRAYTKSFEIDRSGARAFEEVFGTSLAEIERGWRQWALDGGVRIPAERISERVRDAEPVVLERHGGTSEGAAASGSSAGRGKVSPATPVVHPASDAVLRSMLGISLERKEGVQIVRLQSGSSGARADLRLGDAILSVDGSAIESVSDVVATIVRRKRGDEVELIIRRERDYLRVKVTLDAAERDADAASHDARP
jgi:hypothetical protein